MRAHLWTALVFVLGTMAMAGMVASTSEDLRALTVVQVPGALQIPGMILVGFLIGMSLRSAAAALLSLVGIAVVGGLLQWLAISLGAFEIDAAATYLINRGMVQGFYALLLIFFIGMVGLVAALLINVFVRRMDI
jgi:hypothetical protein